MKKALILGLLAATVLPLAACDEKKPVDYSDRDFDGLYDSVDPTPVCNITGYKNNDGAVSEEILVPVDYRNFFVDEEDAEYDKNVGVMMAIVANNSYMGERAKWSVSTSKYENEDSKINPVLVQFGFNQVEHAVTPAYGHDENDVCGVWLGNHILENNGVLYQVYMASIEGYPSDIAWVSNFDLGADTDDYAEIHGEHPEWTNPKHHKGFDVTANRTYTEIEKYMEKTANLNVVDTVVLVTGHSRSAAVSNLVGKKLVDNGIKTLTYAFNGPLTTSEDDEEVLGKYSTIFNIHSSSDYIGRYPFYHMGFTSYGQNLEYDFLNADNAKIYKGIFNQEFEGNTPENLNKIDKVAKEVYPTRDGAYEFDEPETYDTYETLDEAKEDAKDLEESIVNAKIDNYAKVEVIENDDDLTKDEYPYEVSISTRPYCMLKFVAEIIVIVNMSQDKIGDITYMIQNGLPFVGKYFAAMAGGIVAEETEINILKFALPHIQKTCVAGAMVADYVNE